jgi:hypothetical protein
MTTVGLTALEAIRCFAKTLRRGLLCFHLRHVRLLIFLALFTNVLQESRDSLRTPLQAGWLTG